MSYFQKALTEFYSSKVSKKKKAKKLAELCVEREGAKIICYRLSVPMLEAFLERKPARLLAVTEEESSEQKRLASRGRHMISFEGTLNQIQDRVFELAVFRPDSLLTEDLEPLISQAKRLVKEGGTLVFLGEPQQNMYVSLVKHLLTEAGFGQIRFLSDGDYSYVSSVKEKE